MVNDSEIKILILHGWMQSSKRYQSLRKVLKLKFKGTVDLYEFPGFGGTEPLYTEDIIDHFVEDFKEFMQERNYSHIVACSMGANIVIKSLQVISTSTIIILLSPIYYGISRLKGKVVHNDLLLGGLHLLASIPSSIQTLIIKGLSSYSLKDWQNADTRLVRDVLRADKVTAAITLHELTYDKWRLSEKDQHNVVIIVGEEDKVLSRSRLNLLKFNLPHHALHIIPDTGHMAIIESFSSVCKIVVDSIEQPFQEIDPMIQGINEQKKTSPTETVAEARALSKEELEEIEDELFDEIDDDELKEIEGVIYTDDDL